MAGDVKRKSGTASVNTYSQLSKQEACLHVRLRCGSLPITTPVSLLANGFDVRSVLHGRVSLAAASQMYVIHEAIKRLRKYKEILEACFENVNIHYLFIRNAAIIGI